MNCAGWTPQTVTSAPAGRLGYSDRITGTWCGCFSFAAPGCATTASHGDARRKRFAIQEWLNSRFFIRLDREIENILPLLDQWFAAGLQSVPELTRRGTIGMASGIENANSASELTERFSSLLDFVRTKIDVGA
jgi:hypothetical protein